MRTEEHILEALRAYASQKWHGRGCHRSNCGSECLCGPCHARVALERLASEGSCTVSLKAESRHGRFE